VCVSVKDPSWNGSVKKGKRNLARGRERGSEKERL